MRGPSSLISLQWEMQHAIEYNLLLVEGQRFEDHWWKIVNMLHKLFIGYPHSVLLPAPLNACDVLPCNCQNIIKISPLLTWMQLLIAMAIKWNTFDIFQSILRTIFESYTGQLC